MIVHVKVNKSTNFQQLNPICVMLLGVTVNSRSDSTNQHKL